MFSANGARKKKYLLVIVGLLLLGFLGRLFFPVNDTPTRQRVISKEWCV